MGRGARAWLALVLVVGAHATAAPEAGAQPAPSDGLEPPPAAGAHAHDGFLLRVDVGVAGVSGHQQTRLETVSVGGERAVEPASLAVDGTGLFLAVDAGYAVADDLVVHARLSELLLPDPSIEVERGPGWVRARQASFVLLAPAVTYYLMPLHLHATAAAGVAFANGSDFDGDDGMSRPGLGANLDVGWDTWVGEQWCMGLGARLWYASMRDDGPAGYDLELSTLAAGALLALTHQ